MAQTSRSLFGRRFVLLARRWRQALDTELARVGLTDASWAPLYYLGENGDGMTQTQLARCMQIDTSGLVRLLDILEGRGLVERKVSPDDRRARQLVLTKAGRAQVRDLRVRLTALEEQMLRDLDDRTLQVMMDGFDAIDGRLSDFDPKEA